MKRINLKGCPRQNEIATWAIGAMDSLSMQDQEELWGIDYANCPVTLVEEILEVDDNEDVAKDFLYRIEEQLIQMADSDDTVHGREKRMEYNKTLPTVLLLANKVREAFGMELVEREDLAIRKS